MGFRVYELLHKSMILFVWFSSSLESESLQLFTLSQQTTTCVDLCVFGGLHFKLSMTS